MYVVISLGAVAVRCGGGAVRWRSDVALGSIYKLEASSPSAASIVLITLSPTLKFTEYTPNHRST